MPHFDNNPSYFHENDLKRVVTTAKIVSVYSIFGFLLSIAIILGVTK